MGGKKWMYAHTYYTEMEFWKVYDKAWYQNLRKKYKATNLPSVYDKVVVRERYQVDTHGGLVRAITGTAKLRVE